MLWSANASLRRALLTPCTMASPNILRPAQMLSDAGSRDSGASTTCMLLQIAGYFVQGLICLAYMPLCFQLARFTAEAASRVYCDLAKDIAAGQVPDIAKANVPAVTRMFYSLPVSK